MIMYSIYDFTNEEKSIVRLITLVKKKDVKFPITPLAAVLETLKQLVSIKNIHNFVRFTTLITVETCHQSL